MKVLVLFDSFFGNTEKIAQAIGAALSAANTVSVQRVGSVDAADLEGVQLLLVGSPTRGFRATPATVEFLKGLPAQKLQGMLVGAFDTRIDVNDIPSPVLRFVVKSGGYAAKAIARLLQKSGGKLIGQPEGFIVLDREGPLKEGELERAAQWARQFAG